MPNLYIGIIISLEALFTPLEHINIATTKSKGTSVGCRCSTEPVCCMIVCNVHYPTITIQTFCNISVYACHSWEEFDPYIVGSNSSNDVVMISYSSTDLLIILHNLYPLEFRHV